MKVFSGRRIAYFAGLLFAAVLSAGAAFADEPKPLPEKLLSLPVDQLIHLAMENNLGIRIAETQVQLAQLELARQRAEVAMKVSELKARSDRAWQQANDENGMRNAAVVGQEVDQELRLLLGAGTEKDAGKSAPPTETTKASLDIRIGRYGELSSEVKGLPIPQELCRGEGNIGSMRELLSGMWWLNGSRVTATLTAPVDVYPSFVSAIRDYLKTKGIDSVLCLPNSEHMALPTIEDNLRSIGEALQVKFNYSKGVLPAQLEKFVKEVFEIPTKDLKPTDREITYRIDLYQAKDRSSKLWIGVFATLPRGGEMGCEDVIYIRDGSPELRGGSYSIMLGNRKKLEIENVVITSRSVEVPAAPSAAEK
jgi:hypothetical protein